MKKKSNDLNENELEKIRNRLKILNKKVKKFSSSNPSNHGPKEGSAKSRAASLKDVSLEEMRDKLRAINDYLRRRLEDNQQPAATATVTKSSKSTLTAIDEPVKNISEEKKAQKLHYLDHPQFQSTSERLGIGLDLGTAYLVAAREIEQRHVFVKYERNTFLSIRKDNETLDLLERLKIKYASLGEHLYVLGNHSINLANMFNREVQHAMRQGILNPSEVQSIPVIKLIVEHILWPARKDGEICCFSVPATPIDNEQDTIYHKGVFDGILRGLGFETVIIDEGYAVVLSELGHKDFTGIGISCGGGMVNICTAYKSVPTLSFSITRAGDWIDQGAASVLGISTTKVATIKEHGISIRNPMSREEEAIAIYYKSFIRYLLEKMAEIFGRSHNKPQFQNPIDIVFAGGTSTAGDFLDVVEEELQSIDLGFSLGRIQRATEPLTSVSRGCLFHAINSDKNNFNEESDKL